MTDKQLSMKMDQVSLSKKMSSIDKCKEMAVLLAEAYFSDRSLLAAYEKKSDGIFKPVGMVFEFHEKNQGRVTLPLVFSSSRFAKAAPCEAVRTSAKKIVDDMLNSDYPGLVFNGYSEDPDTTRVIIPKGVIEKVVTKVIKASDN